MVDLSFIEDNLSVDISQSVFNDTITAQVNKIIHKIEETVTSAGVKHAYISAIFYTGGSSKIPMIRQMINQLFPQAEIVQGDAFSSVGIGLTMEAEKRSSQ